jgi:hypothetical protein
MEASRHVPVDVTHVIAILVFPHLCESHTPTLEGGMVLTGKDVLAQTASLDLDLSNFL